MGYTTEFDGEFVVTPTLKPEHRAYLAAFSRTRRMKRNGAQAGKLADRIREAVGLPVGPEGAYFVGAQSDCGQEHTPDITDYNSPPIGQPGLWCQWTPNEDGTTISWDGGEKFYEYVEWLDYLLANFLKPWGYEINGEVFWRGESFHDHGKIVAKNNNLIIGR